MGLSMTVREKVTQGEHGCDSGVTVQCAFTTVINRI